MKNSVLRGIALFVMLVLFSSCSTMKKIYTKDVSDRMDKELVSNRVLKSSDLKRLPRLVASYIEDCGWVGKSLPQNFYASFTGYSYTRSHKALSIKGEQYSFLLNEESRIFHKQNFYQSERQRLDVRGAFTLTKLLGLIKIQGFFGKEILHTEMVFYLADLCAFAPGILPFSPVEWTVIDDLTVEANISLLGQNARATLYFNRDGELIEMKSNDCFVCLDGKTLEKVPWEISWSNYVKNDHVSYPNQSVSTWKLRSGDYDYQEMKVTSLEYNLNDTKFRKRTTIREMFSSILK